VRFLIDLQPAGRAKANANRNYDANVAARLGTSACGCQDTTCDSTSDQRCVKSVGKTTTIVNMLNERLVVETSSRLIYEAGSAFQQADGGASSEMVCARQEQQLLWLYVDDKNEPGDLTDSPDLNWQLTIDGDPPSAPTDVRVRSGNEALVVQWTESMRATDFGGYVVFCTRGDKLPVFPAGTYSPYIVTRGGLCPDNSNQSALLVADDGRAYDSGASSSGLPPDGQAIPAPPAFQQLDPAFACSPLLTGGTEVRLHRLQNEITYLVGVAAVDKHGNTSTISQVVGQKPIPTRDFYRDYRGEGGKAAGGFCALADGSGAGASNTTPVGPWLASLGAVGLALVVRRLRRRR
jgi:hypothetical protein